VRRRHAAHRFARAEKCPFDVGGEDAVEPGRVDVLDARLTLEDAGVVDERGNRPEPGIHGLEQANHVRLRGDVGAHGQRFAPRRGDPGNHLVGGGGVRSIVHAHGVAALGGEPRGRRPDPARAAGDEDHFGKDKS
jgi:hypothetical protein